MNEEAIRSSDSSSTKKRRRISLFLSQNIEQISADSEPSSILIYAGNDMKISQLGDNLISITHSLSKTIDKDNDQSVNIADDANENEYQSSSESSEFEYSESELAQLNKTSALDDNMSLDLQLAVWAIQNDISLNALADLFTILRPYHPGLPNDHQELQDLLSKARSIKYVIPKLLQASFDGKPEPGSIKTNDGGSPNSLPSTALTDDGVICETSSTASMSQQIQPEPGSQLLLGQELRDQVRINTSLLQEVLRRQRLQEPKKIEGRLPENFTLPLRTIADIDMMEKSLLSKDIYEQMRVHLSLLGGHSVKSSVSLVMSRLFSVDLSKRLVCTKSHSMKHPIGHMKLWNLIIESVRGNPANSKATTFDIDAAMRLWLRGSGDRGGGRMRRHLRDLQQQQEASM